LGGVDRALEFPLALEQPVHLVVVHGLGELHGDLVELIDEGFCFPHTLFDVAADILSGVEHGFLGKVADPDIGLGAGFSLKLLINPGHDAQEGRFPRAIQTEHADFGAGKEGQGDVFQDFALGGHDLGDAIHRVNVLSHLKTFLNRGLGAKGGRT